MAKNSQYLKTSNNKSDPTLSNINSHKISCNLALTNLVNQNSSTSAKNQTLTDLVNVNTNSTHTITIFPNPSKTKHPFDIKLQVPYESISNSQNSLDTTNLVLNVPRNPPHPITTDHESHPSS